MNSRAQPPPPAGATRAALRLALHLGPLAALSAVILILGTARTHPTRPYLAAGSPPALRFAALPPRSDPSLRPSAAPPPPTTRPPEAATAAGVIAAQAPVPPAAAPPGDESTPPPSAPGKLPEKSALLPDDTRPKVRPEDFLPFFQFPETNSRPSHAPAAAAAPVPSVPPASSATYRQQ